MFPHVEPIPLPAPVWLFKVLELLTVSLHLMAVQMLIGGLLIGTWWALLGRWRGRAEMIDAAGNVAVRLPILMVYVINLGVPPLLFAQVLYGRALYTSSILIGTFWISVIFLLMLCYALLYVMADRAKKGKPWGWIGVVALLVSVKIAMIFTANMTLMVRPQVWAQMYQANALGAHLNSGDPTVLPRWLFMVFGGLATGGVGLAMIGMRRSLDAETGRFLRAWGTRLAAVGIVAQVALGVWAIAAQPANVKTLLAQHLFYQAAMAAWLVFAVLMLGLAIVVQLKTAKAGRKWIGMLHGALFLEIVTMVIVRGGIRDLTLLALGMDAWDRQVEANWIVAVMFLVCFVLGLFVLGWLVTVMARAKKVSQRYV